MLHADELMVGDYVTFSDVQNDSNCPKLKVFIIGNGDVYVSVDGDPVLDLCDSKDLSGIPLTPEILEKNGFVSDNFSPYYLSIEGCSIRFSEHQYGLYCNILRSYQRYDGVCNYVHELQHCLKLVGIEKEITL